MTFARPTCACPGAFSPRLAAALVLGLAAVRGVLLAALLPPFQAPDEDVHFDAVQYLAERGRLAPGGGCSTLSPEAEALAATVMPVAFHAERRVPPVSAYHPVRPDAAARRSPGCGPAATYPPIYYATAALAYRSAMADPLLVRLHRVRLVAVLWTCAGALAAFLFALWMSGSAWDGLLLGTLYAAQPMVGMMGASVNGDAAVLALSAAAFAAVAALRDRPGSFRALAALGMLALAGSLVKPVFLFLLPVLLAATATAISGPSSQQEAGEKVRAGSRVRRWATAAAALAPAGLAGGAWTLLHSVPPPRTAAPATLGHLARMALDPERLEYTYVQLYWMAWGWADTLLAMRWYRAVEVGVGLAALGTVVGWRRLAPAQRWAIAVGAGGTFALALELQAMEFPYLARTGQLFVQGRYLLPLFVPFSAAIVVGLRALGRAGHVPLDPGWAFALLVILLQGAAIVRALERYYTPRLPEAVNRAAAWAAASGCDMLRPALVLCLASLTAAAVVAVARTLRPAPMELPPEAP